MFDIQSSKYNICLLSTNHCICAISLLQQRHQAKVGTLFIADLFLSTVSKAKYIQSH